ncbi:hypothetical protein BJY01DRAFT_49942 [Aspergillus pseudoustus]|uniref:Tim44-like domain-containing protein n=1 Tax=Aspergillus pseudoustus TaxID=1810923 RepID=A0ABR4KNP2_9EURO
MGAPIPKGSLFSATRTQLTVSPPFPTISSQCRQFSLSSHRGALQQQRGMPQTISMKQPAQPSMKARGMNVSRSELPQDIGILPGTFIRPLWSGLPSIFTQPKERLHFEWLWLKSGFQNFFSLVFFSKFKGNAKPLLLKERRQIALKLHKQMYSAFADGDVKTLRKVCCTGLANDLARRISARPQGEKVTWSLEKYNRSPSTLFTGIRVMADRLTEIPELPNSSVRQVTVRITSRQSTGKVQKPKPGAKELMEQPAAKSRDCIEYIVIQKFQWMGEEDEWRIWGQTTATTVDDLSSPFFAMGLSLADRYEAMKESMGRR